MVAILIISSLALLFTLGVSLFVISKRFVSELSIAKEVNATTDSQPASANVNLSPVTSKVQRFYGGSPTNTILYTSPSEFELIPGRSTTLDNDKDLDQSDIDFFHSQLMGDTSYPFKFKTIILSSILNRNLHPSPFARLNPHLTLLSGYSYDNTSLVVGSDASNKSIMLDVSKKSESAIVRILSDLHIEDYTIKEGFLVINSIDTKNTQIGKFVDFLNSKL